MNSVLKAVVCHSTIGSGLRRIRIVPQYYSRAIWPRRMNGLAEVFRTRAAAETFISRHEHVGWNDGALVKILVDDDLASANGNGLAKPLQTSQFAVLFWLSKLLKGHETILDLGGAGGIFYEACRHYDLLRPGNQWHIVDLPEMVRLGSDRHAKLGSPKITFGSSLSESPPSTVMLALGSLQYLPDPLGESGPGILDTLVSKPETILVNKVPLIDGPDVWTVQSHVTSVCSYRLFNRRNFFSYFERNGYVRRDGWSVPELTIDIPFHPEYAIKELEGFCFMRADGRSGASPSRATRNPPRAD